MEMGNVAKRQQIDQITESMILSTGIDALNDKDIFSFFSVKKS